MDSNLNLALICFLVAIVSMAVLVLCYLNFRKGERQTRAQQFYRKCLEFGITDASALQSPDKRQRFDLLVKKYQLENLSTDELLKLIEDSTAAQKAANQAQKQKEQWDIKSRELAVSDRINRYANLHGTEKPVTMLRDIGESLVSSVQGMRYVTTQKESDGAVMAGVASGIGGVIPAMMSFANTERVNQEIRQHNETAKEINEVTMHLVGEANDRAKKYMAKAETMSLKLVSDLPAEELFSMLTFQNTKIAVSQTGTIAISVEVTADSELTIFDHLPAFIDGYVNAEIYDGEKKIGTAKMIFPALGSMFYYLDEKRARDGFLSINGIKKDSQKPVKLEGICLFCGEPSHKYTVKFVPGDLWAMEK